jgi:hypothetical protein
MGWEILVVEPSQEMKDLGLSVLLLKSLIVLAISTGKNGA